MRTWFFYNSKTNNQSETEESGLSRFLREIPEDDMPYTFVWQAGWKHWVPLAKVPELMTVRYMSPPPPPPAGSRYPAENLKNFEAPFPSNEKLKLVKEGTDTNGIQRFHGEKSKPSVATSGTSSRTASSLSKSGGQERRSKKRVEGRLKVMVKCGEQVLRTYTANASTRGVCLEQAIPTTMMDQEIELYIYSPDLNSCLRLTAHLLPNQKDPKRLKFLESNDLTERRLQAWISTLTGETQKIASHKK